MSDNQASMNSHLKPFKDYQAKHFLWSTSEDGRVATITLNRPERKNPLTFESYAELRDLFRDLQYASDVRAIVLTGAGGNFSSGGDVFEIIEPLTRMKMPDLLAFTRKHGEEELLFVFNLARKRQEFEIPATIEVREQLVMPGFKPRFDGATVVLEPLDAFCGKL